jgi:GNAT superfamily N-acetyltransferase
MGYRITPTDDHDLIQEMDGLAFPEAPLTAQQIEAAEWWVARDPSGKPVAYAGARFMQSVEGGCWLSRCAVLAEAQGAGLQRRMIRVRLAWARRHGLTEAYTYTVPWNSPSMNNLIRCGFRTYQDVYCGDGFVYWVKSLE